MADYKFKYKSYEDALAAYLKIDGESSVEFEKCLKEIDSLFSAVNRQFELLQRACSGETGTIQTEPIVISGRDEKPIKIGVEGLVAEEKPISGEENPRPPETPTASTDEDCCVVKITKYLELEKPILDAKGAAIEKIAIRNAFLIERIDKTVQYNRLHDRYYQRLCECGGAGGCMEECCDAMQSVLNSIIKLITQMWECIKKCCTIMDGKTDALYEMIYYDHQTIKSLQSSYAELEKRVYALEHPIPFRSYT